MVDASAVCIRCQLRNLLNYRSTFGFKSTLANAAFPQSRIVPLSPQYHTRRAYVPGTKPEKPKVTNLSSRGLLLVHGQDAARFLQGLTTTNIPSNISSSLDDGFYSAFLNAQGRLLHDAFIYPANAWTHYREKILSEKTREVKGDRDPGFLIEVDTQGISKLAAHLRRHKLRAKVDIRALDRGEVEVFSQYHTQDGLEGVSGKTLHCPDNRAPGFGVRILVPNGSHITENLDGATSGPLSGYHRARHLAGIPEGQGFPADELPYAASLPHETNIDLMGGVDFRKGCYVGQELTIRTQHKGVVRKRILPVFLRSEAGQDHLVSSVEMWRGSGASVDIVPKGRTGRPAGRWIHGVPWDDDQERSKKVGCPQVGLAMCRLEMMTDLVVEAGGDGGGVRFNRGDEFVLRAKWPDGRTQDEGAEIYVEASVPPWIREGIESRTRRGGHDRAVDSSGAKEEAVTEG